MFPLLPLLPVREDRIKMAFLWVSTLREEFLGQRFLSCFAELTTFSSKEYVHDYEVKSARK